MAILAPNSDAHRTNMGSTMRGNRGTSSWTGLGTFPQRLSTGQEEAEVKGRGADDGPDYREHREKRGKFKPTLKPAPAE